MIPVIRLPKYKNYSFEWNRTFMCVKHNFYAFYFRLSFAKQTNSIVMAKENKLKDSSLELSRLVIQYLSEDQIKCDPDIKKDFIHKLKIALKEATETQYWLKVIINNPPSPNEVRIKQLINSIHFMLVKSVKTVISNNKSND
jgi:hypothetical protein